MAKLLAGARLPITIRHLTCTFAIGLAITRYKATTI